jgi:hypothetical protein
MIKLIAALAACATLGACATVTRGTSTNFDVNTNPTGAAVQTTHGFSCPATPCSMRMPRKSAFQAIITKPGYKTTTVSIGNRVTGGGGAAMAGNLLAGGFIGAGVDASNGAMLDHRPDPLLINLEPGEGAVTMNQDQAEEASAQSGVTMPAETRKKALATTRPEDWFRPRTRCSAVCSRAPAEAAEPGSLDRTMVIDPIRRKAARPAHPRVIIRADRPGAAQETTSPTTP